MSRPAAVPRPGTNLSLLVGVVVRPPEVRALPSGAPVAALELRVEGEGTVPVAWVGPVPSACTEGAELLVVGRVRRRFFRSGGATQSRTEVLAHALVPTRQRARAVRALAEALEVVTAG